MFVCGGGEDFMYDSFGHSFATGKDVTKHVCNIQDFWF